MNANPLIAAIASVVLSALGQLSLKVGMSRAAGPTVVETAPSMLPLLVSSMMQPAVLLGLLLYGTGAILWLYVLARWDVSKAYPFVSLGFLLTLTVGVLYLGEHLSWERALGYAFISGGLILIVRS
jgi:drug/metabolite transporter (DMT)-like permease